MIRSIWPQQRGRSTGLGWLLATAVPCAGIWYGLTLVTMQILAQPHL